MENDGEAIPPKDLPCLRDTRCKTDAARTRGRAPDWPFAIARSIATLNGGSWGAENLHRG